MSGSCTVSTLGLVVLCLAIWAAPCIGTVDLIGVGFGLPCLQAVVSTQGCIEELVTSFLSLQSRILGPECCKALIGVDDNCWPKIFPLNPFFPPLLKSFCTGIANQPLIPPAAPVILHP
ncbi:hypothetical protein ACH5RR_005791 [Cinchona calisaya]|uniref:Prolamin-like domain-containing protein n=1 Tax=Cinchona calisaya TaxID=153742 RepID=A0ABD3AM57_9GENT